MKKFLSTIITGLLFMLIFSCEDNSLPPPPGGAEQGFGSEQPKGNLYFSGFLGDYDTAKLVSGVIEDTIGSYVYYRLHYMGRHNTYISIGYNGPGIYPISGLNGPGNTAMADSGTVAIFHDAACGELVPLNCYPLYSIDDPGPLHYMNIDYLNPHQAKGNYTGKFGRVWIDSDCIIHGADTVQVNGDFIAVF